MKTVEECLLHARNCEGKAAYSRDDINRRLLLDAAAQWRKLADDSVKHRLDLAMPMRPKDSPH